MSAAAVELLARAGVRWIASDARVLAQSSRWGYRVEDPEVACRAYRTGEPGVAILWTFTRPVARIGRGDILQVRTNCPGVLRRHIDRAAVDRAARGGRRGHGRPAVPRDFARAVRAGQPGRALRVCCPAIRRVPVPGCAAAWTAAGVARVIARHAPVGWCELGGSASAGGCSGGHCPRCIIAACMRA